jgi:uncharacterized protein YabN with tetrapyrrole methylase and pyrophosphatase domain
MPLSLPALTLARRAQDRAQREELLLATRAELLLEAQSRLEGLGDLDDEQEAARELGQLLFTLTDLGRQLDLDAESALRKATMRFWEGIAAARSKREES